MGKLNPEQAVKSMFDVAEQIMGESERRYAADRDSIQTMPKVQTEKAAKPDKLLPTERQAGHIRPVV
jgi:hypothetical protein